MGGHRLRFGENLPPRTPWVGSIPSLAFEPLSGVKMAGGVKSSTTLRSLSTLILLLLLSTTTIYWINSIPRPEMFLYGESVHNVDTTSINRWTKPSSLTSLKKKYFGAKLSYYPNSESCFQLTRIIKSGDIATNPGPTVVNTSGVSSSRKVCAGCAKALRVNQNGVACSGCSSAFHQKCSGVSRKDLSFYCCQFFTPRITNYNLRGNGLNVVQPSYNIICTTHFCIRLPTCGINYQP